NVNSYASPTFCFLLETGIWQKRDLLHAFLIRTPFSSPAGLVLYQRASHARISAVAVRRMAQKAKGRRMRPAGAS
ncbi:MAG: hypothetical protein FD153_1620, partial [Rhodospirillaceae bacterium]